VAVVSVKKSIETISFAWFSRIVRKFCEGGSERCCRGPRTRLRAAVIATAGPSEAQACQLRAAAVRMALDGETEQPPPTPLRASRAQRYVWAMLLARIHDVLPLVCTRCGRAMRIVAFVTASAVRRILAHVGEPTRPPAILPARAPPMGEFAWEQGSGEDFNQRTPYADEPW
jgi:hypothetical protein